MAWFWWLLIVPVGVVVVLWLLVLLFWLAGYVMERGKDQYRKTQRGQIVEERGVDIHPLNRSPYDSDRD